VTGSPGSAASRGPADLLVVGRIATLAAERGFGWADAMAIGGGRVLAAGTLADIEGLTGRGTRRLILGPDRVVLPGLTDAHLHLADTALASRRVDLEAAATLNDGLALVAAAHGRLADLDAWLEGSGWDPWRWGRWPTAADLRAAAPDRRVALWSHDHHALWASERTLREMGATGDTVDPPGGAIRRAPDGTPDGCFQETATERVVRLISPPTPQLLDEAIEALARELLGLGVVAVHDPGELAADRTLSGAIRACRMLAERGRLAIRVHVSVRAAGLGAAIEAGLRTGASLGTGEHADRARMGWLKLFADGSLGSGTAALIEPYEGGPGYRGVTDDVMRGAADRSSARNGGDGRGVVVTPRAELRRLVERAANAGIAGQIHAIGDAALGVALDVLGPVCGRTVAMPRVEHVQFATRRDLGRFGPAGIAASVQPIHLRSDVDKARVAWGVRAEANAFPLRGLLDAGTVVAFGTDAPVEPIDPWPGIEIAATRLSSQWVDRRPFGAAEAISLEQAIRAAALGPAVVAGEHDRGRLNGGHRADFIVVPANALIEPVEAGGPLGSVRPDLVAVDGEIAFEA